VHALALAERVTSMALDAHPSAVRRRVRPERVQASAERLGAEVLGPQRRFPLLRYVGEPSAVRARDHGRTVPGWEPIAYRSARASRRPTARSPAEWPGFVVSATGLYRKRTTKSR
jgi:hypothetical protein